jgi:DNA-binding MarR family transcriptional regulator
VSKPIRSSCTEPKIDYPALADFRYALRSYLHFAERAVQKVGIEPQQYQALLVIRGLPSATRPNVGALAERMQIRHHSAVELCKRLERSGWITRERGETDRREVLLRLRPKGEKLLETLSQLHHRELQTTAPRLIEALQQIVGQIAGKKQNPHPAA